MKYKVGDIVTIKSKEWYDENKDEYGYIDCGSQEFTNSMVEFCGLKATICGLKAKGHNAGVYWINIDKNRYIWTDEMFEEHDTKFKLVKKSSMVAVKQPSPETDMSEFLLLRSFTKIGKLKKTELEEEKLIDRKVVFTGLDSSVQGSPGKVISVSDNSFDTAFFCAIGRL